jgi:hypothetical protein
MKKGRITRERIERSKGLRQRIRNWLILDPRVSLELSGEE